MKKWSDLALEKCNPVVEAIKQHPFNRELGKGVLNIEKFSYYIEQDTLYLQDFSRALAIIVSKIPMKFMEDFLAFSKGALVAEKEAVNGYFRETLNLKKTGKQAPATISYTSYLLQTSAISPVEVAVAAVFPCFWVYNIVGRSIVKENSTTAQNPYSRWIESYSNERFNESAEKLKTICDELASAASEILRLAMLEAVYKSTVLEWHFWNDAYKLSDFDALG